MQIMHLLKRHIAFHGTIDALHRGDKRVFGLGRGWRFGSFFASCKDQDEHQDDWNQSSHGGAPAGIVRGLSLLALTERRFEILCLFLREDEMYSQDTSAHRLYFLHIYNEYSTLCTLSTSLTSSV